MYLEKPMFWWFQDAHISLGLTLTVAVIVREAK
jgi:hypothetical protein